MADEKERQIRERLDARIALAEYDKIPVRDLVEGLAGGDVERYADLMESVRRLAWSDYLDNDLTYLLDALAAAREENEEAHRSYETLKRSFDLCVADASQMSGRIEDMGDEIGRLREALGPFAGCVDPTPRSSFTDVEEVFDDCGECDGCKAQAALAREDGDDA